MSRSHGPMKRQLGSDYTLAEENLAFNSQMATEWCTKLWEAYKRCPIDFQDRMSHLNVTQAKQIR